MRKSLIALACLSAVAGAATAAEVELYGTVDTYIAVNHNAGKTDVSLRSGGASASFWGIKGTEDIGPDLKAIFKLESAFLTDTGDFPDGSVGRFAQQYLGHLVIRSSIHAALPDVGHDRSDGSQLGFGLFALLLPDAHRRKR